MRRRKTLRKQIETQGLRETLADEMSSARERVSRAMPGRRARRRRRRQTVAMAGAAATGAAAAYLMDPQLGRTRRARLRDRALGMGRRMGRRTQRLGRRVSSDAQGLMERARRRRNGVPPNDATLAAKVESEVLGREGIPKGSIVVNAEQGVVILRGEVPDPSLRGKIEEATREIAGVRGVKNLLHLPGEPAPNKARILESDS